MTIYFIHLAFLMAFIVYSFRLGLNKSAINFVYLVPFYSVAIIDLPGGAYVKPPEIYAAALFVFFVFSRVPVGKKPLAFFVLFLSPFIISLAVNYIDFTPIRAWEIDTSKRTVFFEKLTVKYHLTQTNITQFLYVLVALISFLVVSSLSLINEKKYVERVVINTIYMVSLVGVFQVVSYYLNYYSVYMQIFYNADVFQSNRLVWNVLMGIKRINATFTEPSIFGFFLGISYLFVLLIKDWDLRKIIKMPSIWFSLFVGMMSLSGTFYFSLVVLSGMYIFMAKRRVDAFLFFIVAVIVLLYLYFHVAMNMADFLIQKGDSFEERYFYGFDLPVQNFFINPFFGAAFGTDRPTTLFFNFLVSIGAVGVLFIILALRKIWVPGVKSIVVFWFFAGMLSPDLNLLFPWVYLALAYALYSNIRIRDRNGTIVPPENRTVS